MARIPSTTAPEGAVIPERHPKAPAIGSKIPSHFGHCFGCGELHPTGLHLVAYAGQGLDITAEFTVNENHQGAPGLAMADYCHWHLMKPLENSCGFCEHRQ